MSREIRRVPVDFNHPIEWREERKRRPTFETMRAELTGRPSPNETTVEIRWSFCLAPMWNKSLSQAQSDWEAEREKQLARGILDEVYDAEDLERAEARLAEPWSAGASAREYVEHVQANLGNPKWRSVEEYVGERPSVGGTRYAPEDWPPENERGWVVYETVSEGTPITPCFATPEELVDWLATKGTAWDGPMSRDAAEGFVRRGWAPSVMVSDGKVQSALETFEEGGALAN